MKVGVSLFPSSRGDVINKSAKEDTILFLKDEVAKAWGNYILWNFIICPFRLALFR
jgi:hypothetical protein